MPQYNNSVKNTSHSVNFNDNKIIFDLVFSKDLSGGNMPGNIQFELPHDASFTEFDSNARICVPINNFRDLFIIKLTDEDVEENVYTNTKFAVDHNVWNQQDYSIPFHNALVDEAHAIKKNAIPRIRNIHHDMVRSIIVDIFGSFMFSNIFTNTSDFLNSVKNLDESINTSLSTLFNNLGGTRDNPLTITDISNNPTRDILFGLLTADTKINERKATFIDKLLDTYQDGSFVSLPFEYGDGIRIKLTYDPSMNQIGNRVARPRSYLVTLLFSLESEVEIGFQDVSLNYDLSYQDNAAILNGDTCVDMLWLGSEDYNDYLNSQYYYYLRFEQIQTLQLTMNVDSSNGIPASFLMFARPITNNDSNSNTETPVIFNKIVFFIPETNLVYDEMHQYDNNDFHVFVDNTDTYTSISSFLNTRLNNGMPFYDYGTLQVLSIAISGKDSLALDCKLESAIINTTDDRKIHLSPLFNLD